MTFSLNSDSGKWTAMDRDRTLTPRGADTTPPPRQRGADQGAPAPRVREAPGRTTRDPRAAAPHAPVAPQREFDLAIQRLQRRGVQDLRGRDLDRHEDRCPRRPYPSRPLCAVGSRADVAPQLPETERALARPVPAAERHLAEAPAPGGPFLPPPVFPTPRARPCNCSNRRHGPSP